MLLPPRKLLDQVRDRMRLKHSSLRTEEAYVHSGLLQRSTYTWTLWDEMSVASDCLCPFSYRVTCSDGSRINDKARDRRCWGC